MDRIEIIEQEIEKIKARNKRVETDKEWETSLTRRIFIAISTYILVVILLISIRAENPFLTAIIPAVAYFISTSSLEFVRDRWLQSNRKKTS